MSDKDLCRVETLLTDMEVEEQPDSPYVFRDEEMEQPEYDPQEREVVIVDGQAMSFRSYRR